MTIDPEPLRNGDRKTSILPPEYLLRRKRIKKKKKTTKYKNAWRKTFSDCCSRVWLDNDSVAKFRAFHLRRKLIFFLIGSRFLVIWFGQRRIIRPLGPCPEILKRILRSALKIIRLAISNESASTYELQNAPKSLEEVRKKREEVSFTRDSVCPVKKKRNHPRRYKRRRAKGDDVPRAAGHFLGLYDFG